MKRNKIPYSLLLLLLPAMLLPCSCVKDELFHTPHPDMGAVVVSTYWGNISEETAVPADYLIGVGSHRQRVSKSVNVYDELLPPGVHDFIAYNEPEGFSLSGDVATVHVLDNGQISPRPGYLFCGKEQVTVLRDDTVSCNVAMRQLVRRLEFRLRVSEGDHSRVTSATATLNGVSRSVSLTTGNRSPETASVSSAMEKSGDTYSFWFRIAGIAPGATPVLTVDLLFSNGDTQRVVTDLSTQLRDFNSGVNPVTLSGDLSLPVPQKPSSGSGITGWEVTEDEADLH